MLAFRRVTSSIFILNFTIRLPETNACQIGDGKMHGTNTNLFDAVNCVICTKIVIATTFLPLHRHFLVV